MEDTRTREEVQFYDFEKNILAKVFFCGAAYEALIQRIDLPF